MHQFDEHHAEFKGFSVFYEEKIAPKLRDLEESYAEPRGLDNFFTFLKKHSLKLIFSSLGLAAIITIGGGNLIGLVVIIGAFLIAYAIFDSLRYDGVSEHRDWVLFYLAEFLGISYFSNEMPRLMLWKGLGLIGSGASRYNCRFMLRGELHGAKVEISSLEIFSESQKKDMYAYLDAPRQKNHLIRLKLPKRFHGRTVVYRDQGRGQAKRVGDMKKVGLVDPVFERKFEVYGTDQVEARALLSPDLMQEMVDLDHVVSGREIEFGFLGTELFICLKHPYLDEQEMLTLTVSNPRRTQRILDEIGALFDIIDVILKQR